MPPLRARGRPVRSALVLGLARSGQAAVDALLQADVAVVAVDRDAAVDVGRLRRAGVELHVGRDDVKLLDEGVDVVIKSPGVPSTAPLVSRARELGVPIWSEIELGARLLRNPFLGVTGTNGKTTTTALLGAMFSEGRRAAHVVGNIGTPLTSLVGVADEDAWIVCELSSFQLEDVEQLRPAIAILVNLEPDHIDRHGDFDAYAAAKLRLFERQTGHDVAIVPQGFGPVPGHGRRVEFSRTDELPAEPRIRGAHNRENAAAAAAAARAAGISEDAIARALRSFAGVPHRIEEIATVNGVLYVNDSKATNVAAARRAVATFAQPLHLILGGRGKHESYEPLADDIPPGTTAYLIGESTHEIGVALGQADIAFVDCGNLELAVSTASARSRPGEVVLLSPACASFDQFASFEERGDRFRALVLELERSHA